MTFKIVYNLLFFINLIRQFEFDFREKNTNGFKQQIRLERCNRQKDMLKYKLENK